MIKDSETLLQFFKIRVTSQGHGPFAIGMIFDHCCGTSEASEQQHNQDLREKYRLRKISI